MAPQAEDGLIAATRSGGGDQPGEDAGTASSGPLNIGVGADGTSYQPCMASLTNIGLKTDRVQAIADQIVRGLEELSMAFSFEPIPG